MKGAVNYSRKQQATGISWLLGKSRGPSCDHPGTLIPFHPIEHKHFLTDSVPTGFSLVITQEQTVLVSMYFFVLCCHLDVLLHSHCCSRLKFGLSKLDHSSSVLLQNHSTQAHIDFFYKLLCTLKGPSTTDMMGGLQTYMLQMISGDSWDTSYFKCCNCL